MAFLIYKITGTEKNIRYERFKPIKLGGPDGLVARHVKSLPGGQTASWKLDAAALLRLAGSPDDNFAVIFDASSRDADAICLYELTRLHGSCRDTSTSLALDLDVLIDGKWGDASADHASKFETVLAGTPKKLGETLALTGGPAGGDWKWGQSGLQIGATVVGHSRSGSSHPNCACGRT